MELNRALFLRRRELGLSQRELAERAGISPSFVQNIESGRAATPGFFAIAGLARAMDLDLNQLATMTPGTWKGTETRAQHRREMNARASKRRWAQEKQPSGPEASQRSSSDQGAS